MHCWEMEFVQSHFDCEQQHGSGSEETSGPASGRQHGRVSEEMNRNPHRTIRDFFYLPEVGGRFTAQTCRFTAHHPCSAYCFL